jgi:hypothetical protein
LTIEDKDRSFGSGLFLNGQREKETPSMRAIVKTGEASETFEIPPEYIDRKPPMRREEVEMSENPKYLRQIGTGRIYVYSDIKAKRADMEPYEMPVEEETIVPPEQLDELMKEEFSEPVEEPAPDDYPEPPEEPVTEPTPEDAVPEGFSPPISRLEFVKEAISKILPEEFSKPMGGRPAMPKVAQVSELAGFKVTAAEIIAAME